MTPELLEKLFKLIQARCDEACGKMESEPSESDYSGMNEWEACNRAEELEEELRKLLS